MVLDLSGSQVRSGPIYLAFRTICTESNRHDQRIIWPIKRLDDGLEPGFFLRMRKCPTDRPTQGLSCSDPRAKDLPFALSLGSQKQKEPSQAQLTLVNISSIFCTC